MSFIGLVRSVLIGSTLPLTLAKSLAAGWSLVVTWLLQVVRVVVGDQGCRPGWSMAPQLLHSLYSPLQPFLPLLVLSPKACILEVVTGESRWSLIIIRWSLSLHGALLWARGLFNLGPHSTLINLLIQEAYFGPGDGVLALFALAVQEFFFLHCPYL